MEIIIVYFGVAAIFILAATVDILRPVLNEYTMPTNIKVIYYIVFVLLGFLTAPTLIYPVFSNKGRIEFQAALHKTLFQKN